MAVDKLVDSTQLDTDLTSVANAIRTKGGTSAQLEFPSGFVSAISDISSGYTEKQILWGSAPSGAVNITATSNLPRFVCSGRTGMTSLTIDFGASYGFAESSAYGYNVINNTGCSKYTFISTAGKPVPGFSIASISSCTVTCRGSWGQMKTNAFRSNGGYKNAVTGIDYSSSSGNIDQNAFYECNSFRTLIIRSTAVKALAYTNALTTATYWKSGGGGGTLYVPQRLISSYQSATNWSTILGYTNNNIVAIEGSAYETKYLDGTDCDIRYINKTLTNCTSSNTENQKTIGSAYTTTITASSGYTLDSVTVTMNGVDVTSSVYDSTTGVISIASVDGSIYITATAS